MNLKKMRSAQRKFVTDRDWEKFHSPKNLVLSILIEAAELAEHFQWLTNEESLKRHSVAKKNEVADEMADVFYYLLRLADKLDIDLEQSFWKKLKKNARKYPVSLSKGRSEKYDRL